jgi:hypothetical protein
VRHRRGALLLFAEVLLRLTDLGALEVADFDGNLVESASDDGESADVGSMAIALDNLRGNRGGLETKAFADALFVLRLEVPEGADRA